MARRSRRRMTFTTPGRDFSFPRRSLPPALKSLGDFDLAEPVRYGPLEVEYPPSRPLFYKQSLRPTVVRRPAKPPLSMYGALRVLQTISPRRALHCIRRKARREVLFALRRAGFSGSAPKRRWNRTQDSQWRC